MTEIRDGMYRKALENRERRTYDCTTLDEIKEVLATMGLHLGMDVQGWPPENIEELAKRFEEHY